VSESKESSTLKENVIREYGPESIEEIFYFIYKNKNSPYNRTTPNFAGFKKSK
jgi:hypothetical protein